MKLLITGTSSGFGFALAKYYLKEGNIVYGISRKENRELMSYPNFKYLSQDISDFGTLTKNLSSFLKDTSFLDLVVLNAGILNEIKDLKDTSLDEIKQVMDVNVWANKVIIDTLSSELEEIKQVVAISSGASVSGSRGWNAYSLSKATLNMLISLYAKEHTKTHFCALAPGLIDTAMQDYIFNLPKEKEYPTVTRLKNVKASNQMPKPAEAAKTNAEAIIKAKNYESGSFLDIRNM